MARQGSLGAVGKPYKELQVALQDVKRVLSERCMVELGQRHSWFTSICQVPQQSFTLRGIPQSFQLGVRTLSDLVGSG